MDRKDLVGKLPDIKRTSYISQELDGLFNEVDILEKEVFGLFDRFISVLRNEPSCETVKDKKDVEINVPLVITIRELRSKIYKITNNVIRVKELSEL